jgi:hypothetical protein
MNIVHDCKLMQRDIDAVQNLHLDNISKLNVSETTVIAFTLKTISVNYN